MSEHTKKTMNPSSLRNLWFGLGLLAVGLFLYGVHIDGYVLRLVVKPIPVLCLLLWMWPFPGNAYKSWIALGLVFSIGGDILLEISPRLFLYGLLSFLVAHLCYIVAFTRRYRSLRLLWFVPFVLWGGGVYLFLFPKLGGMALPVGVYVTVICAMMWRATACLGWSVSRNYLAWAGMLGAISFAISDTMIAFNKFNAPFAAARYGIIVLYWLGQWGIAYSVAEPTSESSPSSLRG